MNNEWNFEITQVRGRRVKKYGEPYTAILTMTVVNGDLHVEGLLSSTSVTLDDIREVERYISSLGYSKYTTSHYVDGVRHLRIHRIRGGNNDNKDRPS